MSVSAQRQQQLVVFGVMSNFLGCFFWFVDFLLQAVHFRNQPTCAGDVVIVATTMTKSKPLPFSTQTVAIVSFIGMSAAVLVFVVAMHQVRIQQRWWNQKDQPWPKMNWCIAIFNAVIGFIFALSAVGFCIYTMSTNVVCVQHDDGDPTLIYATKQQQQHQQQPHRSATTQHRMRTSIDIISLMLGIGIVGIIVNVIHALADFFIAKSAAVGREQVQQQQPTPHTVVILPPVVPNSHV